MTAELTTSDLYAVRRTIRGLVERHAPPPPTPDTAPGGYDQRLWRLLAGQVGAAGLAVPEELGGAEAGYLACQLVLTELGRAAVASPFLASSVLATQALLMADDRAVLPALASGETTAALGWRTGLTARNTAGGWLVDGTAAHVLDGARADVVLVVVDDGLFQLDVAHPGLRRAALPTMDQALHLATLRCTAVPATRIGAAFPGRLDDLAATAVSAEQVGGAEACLDQTVAYVQTRVQFGRPIGSFQAIKHRLADLYVLVESAKTASLAAAQAWSTDAPDASLAASMAKAYCSDAYRAAAAEMIQLHGGTGITWEHPAHRYFKRAHSTGALFGDAAHHRGRIAAALG